VLHLAGGGDPTSGSTSPQVGFVVSRAVGNAVVRNRVRRRLRHLVRDRLDRLPDGTRLVVRVLPAAAVATSDQLGRALDRALDRVVAP
jgi:ribonuclease P protein component